MSLVPALAMWCLTAYLFWPRTRQRSWNQSEGLLIRLFAVNFALGLTVQVAPIAGALDQAVGVNNLSWFVAYALCIIGVYFGLVLWLRTCKVSTRRGTLISIGTLLFLVLLFPALAAERETNHDTLFVTPTVLVYSTTVYLWVALTAREVIHAMRLLLSREELPTGQMRIAISMFAVNCGRAFVLVRSLILIVVFFYPHWSLAAQASAFSYALLALLGIGFALALMPLRFLSPAVRTWIYLEQQRTLLQMERLRRELAKLTSPLPWKPATWQEHLLQPSYALYCALIDVLDRRSLLLARTQTRSTVSSTPQRLNWLFAPLPDTEDWVDLLQYFRQNLNSTSRVNPKP
jgi:hypothetical protein